MDKSAKIFVAGGNGLVGSAIIKTLLNNDYTNIISSYHSRKPQKIENVIFHAIDLISQEDTKRFFETHKPEYVILAAAKVGGIHANSAFRGHFIFENTSIQNNIIHYSYLNGVEKLLFLGSSCIYPGKCPQPMKEEYLLTSELEYTNEPYAIAKIAGIKLCESYNLQYGTNFISVMPTNLYGPNDNFHLENSHVLPALIRKIYLAKCLEEGQQGIEKIRKDFSYNKIEGINPDENENDLIKKLERFGIYNSNPVTIKLWGSGTPRREFLHSSDLALACLYILENIDFADLIEKEFAIDKVESPPQKEIRNLHINIGTGKDISIRELAEMIKEIAGFNGIIAWDSTKPDGTYQKLLDVNRLESYGWRPKIKFKDGIKRVFEEYSDTIRHVS